MPTTSSSAAASRLPNRSRSLRQPAAPSTSTTVPPAPPHNGLSRAISTRSLAKPSASITTKTLAAAPNISRTASLRAPVKSTSDGLTRSATVRVPTSSSSASPSRSVSVRQPPKTSERSVPITSSPKRTVAPSTATATTRSGLTGGGALGLARKPSTGEGLRRHPSTILRPAAPSEVAQTRSKPPLANVHRRTKSVVTPTATRPASGASTTSAASAGSQTGTPVTTKPATKPVTKPRALSQHSKSPPTVSGLTKPQVVATGQTTKKTLSSGTTSDASRSRPAFNTLQQHYSPAKNTAPKPATSTYFAPPSPSKLPSNIAATAETSKHQNDLLLLHLLHRDSAAVDLSWRDSARHALSERFESLHAEAEYIADMEADRTDLINAQALLDWGRSSAGGDLERKVQILDSILLGIWNMSEAGGKYVRVVSRFEQWAEMMTGVEEARRRGDSNGMFRDGEVLLVGKLDNAWREECMSLGRRLDEWRRQMMSIGQVPSDTGADSPDQIPAIHRILTGCTVLIRDMLTELAVMEQIENEAVSREEEWVSSMLDDTDESDQYQAGAIWRAF